LTVQQQRTSIGRLKRETLKPKESHSVSVSQVNKFDPISDADIVRLLSDLVEIPSVNPQHSSDLSWPFGEAGVGDYVESFGRAIGLKVERQVVLPGRENVILTLKGADPTRALLFECHMDTVPGWDGPPNPFAARTEGGRLYGRGSCDVKGTMAAMLAAVRAIALGGCPPVRSLIFAAVVDEEHQARGVTYLSEHGPRADAAVVGEPTSLSIAIAHKGCVRWRVLTRGRSVHSSTAHLGINAIDSMVSLLAELRSTTEPMLARHEHPLVGKPAFSVCTIHGGVAVNVIPDRCEVQLDRRTLPGESIVEVKNEIETLIREIAHRRGLDVEIEPPFVAKPGLATAADAPIVGGIARASELVRGRSRVIGVPFGTDASVLSEAGIPSVVFGPGTIDVAHTRDEHVVIADVVEAANILVALAHDALS
jgi:succinyl-diaminopimelate desuccinylase